MSNSRRSTRSLTEGRLGRLLITFLLCAAGVLRRRSHCLKQHRTAYYDLLDRVRAKGDW